MLKVKNMNAKSVNRGLSSLKSYNEFMIREGYMENLVILSMDHIKVQPQLTSPTNITITEAIKFMNRIKQNEVIRNYHITILFLNTGIRISELTNIKLTDIFLNKKKLRVFGKGSKQREIPLNDIAIEIIQDAIKNRENYNYALNVLNSPYLFLSKKSEKLDTGTIERIFNEYSNKITPHKLRHVWATNFL
jgi:integrase/recombinase XerD